MPLFLTAPKTYHSVNSIYPWFGFSGISNREDCFEVVVAIGIGVIGFKGSVVASKFGEKSEGWLKLALKVWTWNT